MKLWAFLKKDLLVTLSYRFNLVLRLFSGLIAFGMFYFIGKTFSGSLSPYLESYGGEYFPYVLVGLAVSTFIFVGLNDLAGKIREAQMKGTLEALLMTPSSIYTILLGNSLWSFIAALFECILILTVGFLFLSLNILPLHALISLLVLLLTFAAFLFVGILAAAFIMIFKQGNPITLIFGTSSYALGGVLFPVEVLPRPFVFISRFLPITHSVRALRELLLARVALSAAWPEILNLTIFILIMAPVSLISFHYAVKRAKKDGSLVQY